MFVYFFLLPKCDRRERKNEGNNQPTVSVLATSPRCTSTSMTSSQTARGFTRTQGTALIELPGFYVGFQLRLRGRAREGSLPAAVAGSMMTGAGGALEGLSKRK